VVRPITFTGQTSLPHFLTLFNSLSHSMHLCDTNFPYKYTSILHIFSFHHLIFSSYLFFYNVLPPLTFHTKSYSSVLGIVWMGKRHGATLQIYTICLSVRLTIKISFALEKKQTLPQPPSSSIFLYHMFNFRCLIILCNKPQWKCKCTIYERHDLLIKWKLDSFFVSFNFGYFQLCVLNIICNDVLQLWGIQDFDLYNLKYGSKYICRANGILEGKKKNRVRE